MTFGIAEGAAIAAIIGAAATTATSVHMATKGGPKPPEIMTPPAPPTPLPKAAPTAMEGDTPTQQARRASARARTQPRTSTLLTGVLGAPQSQSAVRSTILGGNRG